MCGNGRGQINNIVVTKESKLAMGEFYTRRQPEEQTLFITPYCVNRYGKGYNEINRLGCSLLKKSEFSNCDSQIGREIERGSVENLFV